MGIGDATLLASFATGRAPTSVGTKLPAFLSFATGRGPQDFRSLDRSRAGVRACTAARRIANNKVLSSWSGAGAQSYLANVHWYGVGETGHGFVLFARN